MFPGRETGRFSLPETRVARENGHDEPMTGRPRGEIPESTPQDRRNDALQLLIKAREHLIAQMAEEIVSNRDAILGDPSQTGLFGFEFQEIEDRYIGRLNAINSILDNLEHRTARVVNKTEVLFTNKKRLKKDLDDLIEKYTNEQYDLVNIATTKVSDDQLMLIVAFTADEYPDYGQAGEGEAGGGDQTGGEDPPGGM